MLTQCSLPSFEKVRSIFQSFMSPLYARAIPHKTRTLVLFHILQISSVASAHNVAVRCHHKDITRIARHLGYENLGQVGPLNGHYELKPTPKAKHPVIVSGKLKRSRLVTWHEFQQPLDREKRAIKRFRIHGIPKTIEKFREGTNTPKPPPNYFSDKPKIRDQIIPHFDGEWVDPLYAKQWYLQNDGTSAWDMNVQEAWRMGITGKGVVVTIVDDGIEWHHPDLRLNYDPQASLDINGNDTDPRPTQNDFNQHGTRCAGIVASQAGNEYCGVGIAYGARIGGVRLLDGPVYDSGEARALSLNPNHVDIYSVSWGPRDNGTTFDGPRPLTEKTMEHTATHGRKGKGGIIVTASGNGGRNFDSCSADGYAMSRYALPISAVTRDHQQPSYAEQCPSVIASTYSTGIVTVERVQDCTTSFTGTSASAPVAAGIIALALEANPNLTLRDLNHLLVETSHPDSLLDNPGWFRNGKGKLVSSRFGFGLMDAGALVKLAMRWKSVPKLHKCVVKFSADKDKKLHLSSEESNTFRLRLDSCPQGQEVKHLEHVESIVTVQYTRRGDLGISLLSPAATKSVLLPPRLLDNSTEGLTDWKFMSRQFWGENPGGEWVLEFKNRGDFSNEGRLLKWTLIVYGTLKPPQ